MAARPSCFRPESSPPRGDSVSIVQFASGVVYSHDGELGEDKEKRCLIPLVRVDQRQRFAIVKPVS